MQSLLFQQQLYSAELGAIKLKSYLFEPLAAEIPLTLGQEDPAEIKVFMGSTQHFRDFGYHKTQLHRQIKLKLSSPNGEFKVILSSDAVIREPLLPLIIGLSGVKGSLYREYSLLFNPRQPSPPSPAVIKTAPLEIPQLSPETTKAAADHLSDAQYGPIAYGSSITLIAQKIRPDKRYSIHKIAQLLYAHNPQAFGRSINHLKAGAMLNIPDLQQPGLLKTTASSSQQQMPAPAPLQPAGTLHTKRVTITGKLHVADSVQSNKTEPEQQWQLRLAPVPTESAEKLTVTEDPFTQSPYNREITRLKRQTQQLEQEKAEMEQRFNQLLDKVDRILQKNETLSLELVRLQNSLPNTVSTPAPLIDNSLKKDELTLLFEEIQTTNLRNNLIQFLGSLFILIIALSGYHLAMRWKHNNTISAANSIRETSQSHLQPQTTSPSDEQTMESPSFLSTYQDENIQHIKKYI